jgi:hypothetical protein
MLRSKWIVTLASFAMIVVLINLLLMLSSCVPSVPPVPTLQDDNDWCGIGSGSLYPCTLTDKVGIGTTDPQWPLHVVGNVSGTDNGVVHITNQSQINATGLYAESWTYGIKGKALNPDGSGVLGFSNGPVGKGAGIGGLHNSADGKAVFANNFNPNGFAFYAQGGKNYFENNVGIGTMNPQEKLDVNGNVVVRGNALEVIGGSGSYIKIGNAGDGYWTTLSYESDGINGYDTYIRNPCGKADGCDLILDFPYGNVGIGTTSPAEKLDVIGNIRIDGNILKTGTNSFVQPHPTDPTKEIVYISLEGPEAGTYIRGTAQLVNGEAMISLPEHFSLVTSDEGLTVQLTPVGEWLQLYVVEKGTHHVIVHEANGKNGQFDYMVQGVRKGYENHQVIQEKE